MSFRKPFNVKRTVAGAYVNGVYVEGAESTITIQASVQPVSGQDLVSIPEGRRASDMVKVYTDSELFGQGDAGTGQSPDRLVYRSKEYEIYTKDVNQSDIINHFKYFAVKEPI